MKSKIPDDAHKAATDMFRNREILLACKGHVWQADGPRFQCTTCKGKASPILRELYEQGKTHGGSK